ncbi:MAG TPA: aminopeptidase P N-terminal domain-containing protein [Acidimicrobiia bacterium]|nr:aminopeptidase P N-terminal domain-containing protein [Acidimicrobiia bacterium]
MSDRFADHRSALATVIGDGGMAIVPAAAEAIRNDDVTHPFRQDSNFHYLTGFHEPDAVCVLVPGHPEGDFHLFVRPRDREMEIWTGYRVGTDGARDRFRADAAHELSEFETLLPRLMQGRDTLFYSLGNKSHDDAIGRLLDTARSHRERFGIAVPLAIHDLGSVLADLRLRKSASEIESLRAACSLSAEGHREAMRFARPEMYEYQVQAAMEYVWREAGSPRNGYPSIVASGPNAIVLHYVENDRQIEDGDLVLIDAAAEVDMYSSDITRTFPASGTFTAPQRAVYEVVLAAERAGIRAARPGATLRDVHDASTAVLAEGLVDLGLVPGSSADVLEMHLYRQFFMHGTSHWLGLDVHDAGSYRVARSHRRLEEGMAFTVEPGLYIAPDRPEVEFTMLAHDLDAWTERRILQGTAAAREAEEAEREGADKITHRIPDELLGIGVRIEDDVVITSDGHENLTSAVPTDVDRIEALCAEDSWLHRA